MYNKILDVFIEVADQSSFTRASEQLYISHTAVIKQMNQLESMLGVKLFKRSHRGIILTSAGYQLYKEAKDIIKFNNSAISRVQNAYFNSPKTLKVGTSILYPCHIFMDLWDRISELCPQYSLEVVSLNDDKNRLAHLNNDFDFIVCPYNNLDKNPSLSFYSIGQYRFSIMMDRNSKLAKKRKISFSDLKNKTLMIMQQGTSPINDKIRYTIQKEYPEINIQDIPPHYDMTTFNRCIGNNQYLLSLECWNNVHPATISKPLVEEYYLPYGIVIHKDSKEKLKDFINSLNKVIS